MENTLPIISYARFRGICTQDMAQIHGAHSGRICLHRLRRGRTLIFGRHNYVGQGYNVPMC